MICLHQRAQHGELTLQTFRRGRHLNVARLVTGSSRPPAAGNSRRSDSSCVLVLHLFCRRLPCSTTRRIAAPCIIGLAEEPPSRSPSPLPLCNASAACLCALRPARGGDRLDRQDVPLALAPSVKLVDIFSMTSCPDARTPKRKRPGLCVARRKRFVWRWRHGR